MGESSGAMSMAPMITAAESLMRPNVAMTLERAVTRTNPAVSRDARRRSETDRMSHHGATTTRPPPQSAMRGRARAPWALPERPWDAMLRATRRVGHAFRSRTIRLGDAAGTDPSTPGVQALLQSRSGPLITARQFQPGHQGGTNASGGRVPGWRTRRAERPLWWRASRWILRVRPGSVGEG